MPPNTTAVCQPLDQGIIQNFKVHYKGLILQHLLAKIGIVSSALDLAKSIDVLEALYFIKTSWDKVQATTIKNCFQKAGFSADTCNLPDFVAEDDIPLATYANLKQLLGSSCDFDEFLKIDENVCTEDDCIEILNSSAVEQISLSENSEDEASIEIPDAICSYDQALKQIARLKH